METLAQRVGRLRQYVEGIVGPQVLAMIKKAVSDAQVGGWVGIGVGGS